MIHRGRLAFLVATVALAACGGAAPPETTTPEEPRGEPVALQMRLEAGAMYEGRLSMVHVLPTGHRIETDLAVRTRVLGVEGDAFRLEDTFGDLRLRMNGEELEPAPEMEDVEDVRIRYVMDRRGRTVGEAEALGVTESNAAFAEQLVATASSDEVPYPAGSVRPGETWAATREVEMETAAGILEGEIEERHELARVETENGEEWAVIHIDGSIRIDPLETEELRIRGEGEVSGERRILLRDGFTSRAHTELTVTFQGRGGSPPRKLRMQERTSTRLRVARVDPPETGEPRGTNSEPASRPVSDSEGVP